MSSISIALVITAVIFYSCNQPSKPNTKRSNKEINQNFPCSDTISSDIYDFLNIVIRGHNLDTTYGIREVPLQDLNSGEPDSSFLQKHLIPYPVLKKAERNPFNVIAIGGEIDKCLNKEDIQYMLSQKNKNVNFQWQSKCVNLKDTNKFGEKYIFSVPLFSKDKTKFIITIENYRAGGVILLYKRENNSWTSTVEDEWIH